MDRPKCQRFPSCGKRHFATEPCSEKALTVDAGPDTNDVVDGGVSSEHTEALSQVERNRRWRANNPDRYKKYQRDYMRKKRSKK